MRLTWVDMKIYLKINRNLGSLPNKLLDHLGNKTIGLELAHKNSLVLLNDFLNQCI